MHYIRFRKVSAYLRQGPVIVGREGQACCKLRQLDFVTMNDRCWRPWAFNRPLTAPKPSLANGRFLEVRFQCFSETYSESNGCERSAAAIQYMRIDYRGIQVLVSEWPPGLSEYFVLTGAYMWQASSTYANRRPLSAAGRSRAAQRGAEHALGGCTAAAHSPSGG